MIGGVNIVITISTTIKKIIDQLELAPIPIVVYTDLYLLYDLLMKLGTTKEKRLIINIMALRQLYERRKLQEVR